MRRWFSSSSRRFATDSMLDLAASTSVATSHATAATAAATTTATAFAVAIKSRVASTTGESSSSMTATTTTTTTMASAASTLAAAKQRAGASVGAGAAKKSKRRRESSSPPTSDEQAAAEARATQESEWQQSAAAFFAASSPRRRALVDAVRAALVVVPHYDQRQRDYDELTSLPAAALSPALVERLAIATARTMQGMAAHGRTAQLGAISTLASLPLWQLSTADASDVLGAALHCTSTLDMRAAFDLLLSSITQPLGNFHTTLDSAQHRLLLTALVVEALRNALVVPLGAHRLVLRRDGSALLRAAPDAAAVYLTRLFALVAAAPTRAAALACVQDARDTLAQLVRDADAGGGERDDATLARLLVDVGARIDAALVVLCERVEIAFTDDMSRFLIQGRKEKF